MSTTTARLQYLLQQYADNNCTRQELLELLQTMEQARHHEPMHSALLDIWQNITQEDTLPAIDKEKIYNTIIAAAPAAVYSASHKFGWWKMAAAAVLVLALGLVLYVYVNKPADPKNTIVLNNTFRSNKAALTNKPILTLANGTDIMLHDTQTFSLPLQEGSGVVKSGQRQLVYTTNTAPEQTETVHYHTLTVPAGNPYQLVLPDGSRVWLNAASSIRYPVVFSGKERTVAITGEAYFEINSLPLGAGKKMPFKVQIANARGESRGEVEVLGTHFNINAYEEEASIKTTLVEGRVKVSSIVNLPAGRQVGQSSMLKPGQQASLSHTTQQSPSITVQSVNVQHIIAWKNEELVLNDITMAEAARMISRKYNVRFVFKQAQLAKCHITTSFAKGDPLQKVMEVICYLNDCKYQIKNNEVILSGKGCD
jgi:ferric-dicitrate binding protein FerR (iron transport regulator)